MNTIRVECLQIAGWKEELTGIWLAENADWVLLRYIPVDYAVDGYVLVAKQHIVSREAQQDQKQLELVLQLKGITSDLPRDFAFVDSVIEALRWVTQRYEVVQFQEEEDATYLGWVRAVEPGRFRMDSLTPSGTINHSYDEWFEEEDIRVISFDNDYINSLKLLWKERVRQKWQLQNDN
jgi:hypothetical protein